MKSKYKIILNPDLTTIVLGQGDKNLIRLQKSLRSNIVVRGSEVIVEGPPEEENPIRQIFKDLSGMAKSGTVDFTGIDAAITLAGIRPGGDTSEKNDSDGHIVIERPGLTVRVKSRNQEEYVNAALKSDLTFAIGPAGTGKTYLAVALAVKAFLADEVDRIILVRPAVEAGENLGFLPGDMKDKVDPYFRPLYDSLIDMLTANKLKRYMDQDRIEVAPLAYMRGRTLNNAFVILDEAQNTTGEQLKMFLTRLGRGSRAIVTGDLTQIDLIGKKSGLAEAVLILRGIKGISFVSLDHTDVVRHKLVRDIIQAYENDDQHEEQK